LAKTSAKEPQIIVPPSFERTLDSKESCSNSPAIFTRFHPTGKNCGIHIVIIARLVDFQPVFSQGTVPRITQFAFFP